MAKKKFLSHIDLSQNEIQNAVIHALADSSGTKPQQIWFDPVDKVLKTHDGDAIKAIGTPEFREDSGYVQWRLLGESTWKNLRQLPKLSHTQEFIDQTEVLVNHNMGKYPSVYVTDTVGTEYEVGVRHLSENTLEISVTTAMSGKIICN